MNLHYFTAYKEDRSRQYARAGIRSLVQNPTEIMEDAHIDSATTSETLQHACYN